MIHHGIFRRLQYANRSLMVINLALLMTVAFLPFPTKLVAEAIHDKDAERAAVIFYGATLLVVTLLSTCSVGRSRATATCSSRGEPAGDQRDPRRDDA